MNCATRHVSILFFLLLLFQNLYSQVPDKRASLTPQISQASPPLRGHTSKDICSNGIDDDSNGLIDEKDFSCYYQGYESEGCSISKIIWACSNQGLHWADPETGQEIYVGNFDGRLIDDITWASDGKLYGVANYSNEIFEIDPYTSSIKSIGIIPGYYSANGLTSDLQGNLYVAAIIPGSIWEVVKFNIATGVSTRIVSLASTGFGSGGDLTFLNGFLYLAATDSRMIKINVTTRSMDIRIIDNTPFTSPMGLITMGDGYLYISTIKDVYRIDPNTMKAESSPYYTFQRSDIYMRGLSNYTEHCNAPSCKSKVTASIVSMAPYCSNQGVWLKATGTGINGLSDYLWTLPNGNTVRNDSLQVFTSGRYIVRYHTIPDTCGTETYLDVVVKDPPEPYLGNDTLFCTNGFVTLTPKSSAGILQYLWQNGSTQSSIDVSQQGEYWLEASNECATKRDTIMVYERTIPSFSLGQDTVICPGSSIVLNNQTIRDPWDHYVWQDGSTQTSFTATAGGVYWLNIDNVCGSVRDSIIITGKDSCSCFPFYPRVNLGPDQVICSFETATIKNLSHEEGFKYSWNTGSSSDQIITSDPGIYILKASTYCGTETDTLILALKTQGCIRDIFVPTAFTPNNDGLNDILLPGVFDTPSYYVFSVYNRWGQVVFSTHAVSKGWDGRFQGKLQDSGVFIWQVDFQFTGEGRVSKKGVVTLVR